MWNNPFELVKPPGRTKLVVSGVVSINGPFERTRKHPLLHRFFSGQRPLPWHVDCELGVVPWQRPRTMEADR